MNKYEIDGFDFYKVYKNLYIFDIRLQYGYVQYRYIDDNGRKKWKNRYELVWKYYKDEERKFGMHIHHINMNKIDDRPENLVQITRKEHAAIHGKIYSVDGEGGSGRNTGLKHSKATKIQMSEQAMGNNNSPSFRNNKWTNRISGSSKRNARKGYKSDVKIRDVVRMYCREGMATIPIADKYNVTRQVIKMRLKWFIKDNSIDCVDSRDLIDIVKDNNLNKYIYGDEIEHDRDKLEYKIIKYRIIDYNPVYLTIERLGGYVDEIHINKIISDFRKFFEYDDIPIKYIRKDLLKKDYLSMLNMFVKSINQK